jgi:glycosyltransferase involved in cell wall biosynthesis
MLKVPHLSICIPTYRQIEFLSQTLTSVKAQDFSDYEIIISDDSPDNSVAELVATFDFGGRLRYYRNSIPLGSPENWNAAIRRAKGKYIKLLHHDDKLAHPGALSAFVRLLDKQAGASFAFGASLVEDVTNGTKRIHQPTLDQLTKLSISPEKLFFGNFIGAPSATIYRNGIGVEYDNRLKWLVDMDFYIQVLQKNKQYAYTPEVLIITPTNAVHQVTEICKNNAAIELNEYMLLYKKVEFLLLCDPETRYVWFRLFERYQVFSQKDVDRLGVKLSSGEEVLAFFFSAYRRVWMRRLPYRVYKCLPESIKRVIRRARKAWQKVNEFIRL